MTKSLEKHDVDVQWATTKYSLTHTAFVRPLAKIWKTICLSP